MQQRGRGGIHPKNALRCTARGEEFCFCGIDVVQYLPSAPEETAAFFGSQTSWYALTHKIPDMLSQKSPNIKE